MRQNNCDSCNTTQHLDSLEILCICSCELLNFTFLQLFFHHSERQTHLRRPASMDKPSLLRGIAVGGFQIRAGLTALPALNISCSSDGPKEPKAIFTESLMRLPICPGEPDHFKILRQQKSKESEKNTYSQNVGSCGHKSCPVCWNYTIQTQRARPHSQRWEYPGWDNQIGSRF